MKNWTFAALIVLSPLSAFAEEETFVQEKSALTVKGLLLVPKQAEKLDLSETQGVQIRDLEIPGSAKVLAKLLSSHAIGKPLTPELLREIKQVIIRYYRAQNHPVVTVLIPEQDISDGVIEVIIIEGRLGKIVCKGNRWFSDKLIQNFLDIDPGEIITDDTLLTDVTWMNRNPFRRTDILFTPGEEFGTTDVELVTRDRFPLRFYTGGDDTGNEATGNERWFAGFQWGNAFFCDHLLNYQYTTSSDFHDFQAHTVNYNAPLPWRHILILFGGYGMVHPDLRSRDNDLGDFKSHGHSAQASLRYQMPIGKLYRSTLKEFVVGFDFKNTNNNLEFIGGSGEPVSSDNAIPIITKSVNITQLVGGFNWGKETGHHRFSFSSELFWSPGKILPHQSNEDFENLRPGAKNHYVYGKATLGDVYTFPVDCSVSVLLRGQLASQNLLPSEQYGLGGFNTVRGYNEREVNVDNAFIFNFEIRSFPFHLFKKSVGDELVILGFVDYATGSNHKTIPDEKEFTFLLGAGPGLRYTINPYLSLRVDWGFKLHKTHFDDPKLSKVHFGFILSY